MKTVSFEIAKALKEAGYPQECQRYQYTYEGRLVDLVREGGVCYGPVAPTYMEVWLWLWRKKKIEIELLHDGVGLTSQIRMQGRPQFFNNDPEEAIEQAIVYLVDNNLIK